MRVTVVGLGYVGLVSAACLADQGHDVVGVEVDPQRIRALEAGRMPIFEPGLEELVADNVRLGRLQFTGRGPAAVAAAQVTIVAVGTDDGRGGWQTRTMLAALAEIAQHIADDGVLVVRSTLPPDFVPSLAHIVNAHREEVARPAVPVILNPEFTREGRAVHDFLQPDRVVLGVASDPDGRGVAQLRRMYHWVDAPVKVMTAVNACFTKLGSNLFLATKISFANELAALCDTFGAEVDVVVNGMSDDTRIGGAFLRAGIGFGGSCLPHQVTSVVRTSEVAGVPTPLLAAVDDINHRQRSWFVDKLESHLNGSLVGRRIALLGLAFKPETDDLREAPSLDIAALLLSRGATVVAHDPMPAAMVGAADRVPGLATADSAEEALAGADAVGLVTEWSAYRALDWVRVAGLMPGRVVVDGRNALPRGEILDAGFSYVSFGRGAWHPDAERPLEVVAEPALIDTPIAVAATPTAQPVLAE